MLAESPERDRDIEGLQTLIRNCAAAGIPSIKYNMSLLGVLRTGSHSRARRRGVQHLAAEGRPSGDAPDARRPRGCRSRTGSASHISWIA